MMRVFITIKYDRNIWSVSVRTYVPQTSISEAFGEVQTVMSGLTPTTPLCQIEVHIVGL